MSKGAKPVASFARHALEDAKARFVRVTATKLWERRNDFVFALAELQVRRQGLGLATIAILPAMAGAMPVQFSYR